MNEPIHKKHCHQPTMKNNWSHPRCKCVGEPENWVGVNIWYFWELKFLILLFLTSLLIESRTDLQQVRLIWPIWTRDTLLARFQFCKLCKRLSHFNSYSITTLIKTYCQCQKPNLKLIRKIRQNGLFRIFGKAVLESNFIFRSFNRRILKFHIPNAKRI